MVEKVLFEIECSNCHKTIQQVRTRRGYIRTQKSKNRVAMKWVKGKHETRIKNDSLK